MDVDEGIGMHVRVREIPTVLYALVWLSEHCYIGAVAIRKCQVSNNFLVIS